MTSAAPRIGCDACKGHGWVCVNHPTVPWNDGKGCPCGAEGMACICNPNDALPPGTQVIVDTSLIGRIKLSGDG